MCEWDIGPSGVPCMFEAAWRVVDGILDDRTPLHEYDPGTWGPDAATAILACAAVLLAGTAQGRAALAPALGRVRSAWPSFPDSIVQFPGAPPTIFPT